MDFDQWMKQVDRVVQGKIGLSVHDLSDKCWRDEFDSDSTPEDAVLNLLGDLDDPDDLFDLMMD